MTNDRILEAAAECRRILIGVVGEGFVARRCETSLYAYQLSRDDRVGHLLYCVDQIGVFVTEGRTEKAFRWLGFVQGCLWLGVGCASIDELGRMNMPKEAT